MTRNCIGWDVGGAHLKAVLLNEAGLVQAVTQVYCPLWRGLNELEIAIDSILQEFNADMHAVTMTGELADIFAGRRDGVMQIAATLAAKLHGEVRYYAGRHGYVNQDAVEDFWRDIASINWLASAQYTAQKVSKALFVDVGSTTTDIALIDNAIPQIKGFTDATRMQCDELVYTGVVRTPLMAMAQKILFAGQMTNVAAEYFASAADVYTLTGDLHLAENMAETADGADKTIQACACRIARMIGCDADDAPLTLWVELANAFKKVQLEQIRQALLKQMTLLKDCSGLQLIGAGAGTFLVAELAVQLGLEFHPVADFIASIDKEAKDMAAVCFPAYAVAYLSIKDSGVFA
ncbi:MAG TPA: hydantoinase/oxoprolinase family protein [Methylotenera sp.]